MSDVRPFDPLLSDYPLPLSERRAKWEARRARASDLKLPNGHPYAVLPAWVPYARATQFEALRLKLLGKKPGLR
jgi:hypothetical protein